LGNHQEALGAMSEAPPIFWSNSCGGYWVIHSHALAFEAAHATDLFSNRAMKIPRDDAELEVPGAIPLMCDPPDHARYRVPLAKLFGPQRMMKMEGKIRTMTIELIDAVKDKGGCNFVKDVAEPLPVLTFMNLVGMDVSRLREFRELAVVGSVDPDPETRKAASARVAEIMSDFIDDRLANPRDGVDDITAQLIATSIDGRPIETAELKSYFKLLFFAGLDTVVNAMAFAINYLARHPELQAQCRNNIGKVKLIAEELLRLGAPAVPGRMVTRDEIWHGATLRKGDRALLGLAQANLDPAVFPDPLVCNPDRAAINHLTFNSGPHRCIGQHLARIELRVMYEEWLTRIPAFRPDPDRQPMMHGGMVMGVESLPLVWDA
jgi:cytochrome P450